MGKVKIQPNSNINMSLGNMIANIFICDSSDIKVLTNGAPYGVVQFFYIGSM